MSRSPFGWECNYRFKSWIGLGSCVIENTVIGENVLVGAGSLVLEDLPNNVKAFGSPARLRKKIN